MRAPAPTPLHCLNLSDSGFQYGSRNLGTGAQRSACDPLDIFTENNLKSLGTTAITFIRYCHIAPQQNISPVRDDRLSWPVSWPVNREMVSEEPGTDCDLLIFLQG